MNRQTNKRLIALSICFALILGFLLSAWFVIDHADHDCVGHDCTVCAQLHTAENLFRQLGAILVCAALLYTVWVFAWSLYRGLAVQMRVCTLVSLKVRMDQ